MSRDARPAMKGLSGVATALLIAASVLLAVSDAAAQGSESRTSVTRPMMTGTFIDAAAGKGAFSGNLALTQFGTQQGFLVVVGTLTGTLANSTGELVGRVNEQVVVPVTVMRATCQQLSLEIATLDLDLLGQRVHLDRLALGITARDAPAGALRNRLCSAAQVVAAKSGPDTVAPNLNSVLSAITSPR